MFGITSRGVRIDSKIFNNEFNDLFNLAWRSKIAINEQGVSEIKILTLLYSKKEIQKWNINFADR